MRFFMQKVLLVGVLKKLVAIYLIANKCVKESP